MQNKELFTINPENGISIIVPFFNEEDGILLFCKTIDCYVASLDFPIELVFVNDGSTDNSLKILQQYTFQNVYKAKLIDLSRNFGSHAAIRAGFIEAHFGICMWLGADLQEPLELIPASYKKIKEGFDAVYIEKRTIQVSKANRTFSKLYARLMQKYAVSNYSSGGTSVIVVNSKIKNYLNSNIENNSSIMLQILDAGFKSATLSLNFNERSAGESKWTLKKKIKLLIDSFVAFSFAPIRLVSLIGIIFFIIGFLMAVFIVINKIINPNVPVGYTSLACIMTIGFGITNISIGIIAEYLWRGYDAARGRPCYIISDIYDLHKKVEEK